MRNLIKKIIFYFVVFVLSSFLFWFVFLIKGGTDAAILMYHSVGEATAEKTTLSISEKVFERQMKFLKEHHYHVIPLLDLALLLRDKKQIPPRTVVITFDDGYENMYTTAFPVLKKYHLPATMFIITNFLGREKKIYGHRFKFMTPQMLREMSDSGLITFGAHTKNHAYLPDIENEKILVDEIDGSKVALEKILNKPVYAFCYPKGGYTSGIQSLVRKAGYAVAVTTLIRKGFAHDDLYALKRIKITESAKNLFVFFVETSGYFLRMKEMSK